MTDDPTQSKTVQSRTVAADLFPVVFRATATVLLVPSAVLKLVEYGSQAALFADLGIPAPGVTVVGIALLELATSALIVTGVESRLGAAATVPIMVVAIALVGPVVSNVAVLVACLGILGLGPGRYTLGDAERDLLQRVGATLG